jgi:hypothetical protein
MQPHPACCPIRLPQPLYRPQTTHSFDGADNRLAIILAKFSRTFELTPCFVFVVTLSHGWFGCTL